MIDPLDFIAERGGDPKKIKESQRRRHASEEVVDVVIAMFEDARKSEELAVARAKSNWADGLAIQHGTQRRRWAPRSTRCKKR